MRTIVFNNCSNLKYPLCQRNSSGVHEDIQTAHQGVSLRSSTIMVCAPTLECAQYIVHQYPENRLLGLVLATNPGTQFSFNLKHILLSWTP